MSRKEKESHVGRQTIKDVEKFAQVLVDPVNGFAFRLDRVELKKSSNNEVYEHMRKIFYEELTKKYFIEINENNNFKDKGKFKGYKELDIPLQDFRVAQFIFAHQTWKWPCFIKRSTLVYGYGSIFSETNAEIRLSSSAHETSFVLHSKYTAV